MWDLEAFVTWADAMGAVGRVDETVEKAHFFQHDFRHTTSTNWWRRYIGAALHCVLDENEQALTYVDEIRDSPRLPFLYLVRDTHCLQKYIDNPRYVAAIKDIEDRQRELREQLPETLARFSVSIPELMPVE